MSGTSFLGSLAVLISEMGLANLEIRDKAAGLEREVAERRLAEERLREGEEKYRRLVDTTQTGYLICDVEGAVLDANEEYVRLTGRRSLEEILGRRVTEWTAPNDLARNAEEVRKCAATGSVRDLEIDYLRPDGTSRTIEINATTLPTVHGPRILTLCRDVTERKRSEARRLEIEKNMLQVQKLESLGLLAGGIAHDFNNLLTGILGNVDLAMDELPGNSALREKLQDIRKAGGQAADLCRQMLAYSGKGRFVTRTFHLRELIGEMESILARTVAKKVRLEIRFAEGVPPIEGDPSQIRQVLMNLVINGSEAIGAVGGVITIAVGACFPTHEEMREGEAADGDPGGKIQPGSYVKIEVSDTGCGIDPDQLPKIFQPFYSTKFTGRGLGLAAVQGIVRSHRGAVRVRSSPGQGTTFTVLLPTAAGMAEGLTGATDHRVSWRGSGTVLLADDEEIVRVIGRRMLQHLGFEVILAADGREALECLELAARAGKPFVCVVLDLTMPHLDGFEVLQEIHARYAGLPVVLSSGYHEQDVLEKCRSEKPDGFVQKPYHVKELAAVLQEALKRRA